MSHSTLHIAFAETAGHLVQDSPPSKETPSQRGERIRKAKAAAKEAEAGTAEQQYLMSPKELVARFTLATNELQLMGIVKPNPGRKGGSFAKRLFWPAEQS